MGHGTRLEPIIRYANSAWPSGPYITELGGREGELPDYLRWCTAAFVPVVEYKDHRSDWQADKSKAHRSGREPAMGSHIWVAAPKGIIESYEAEELGFGFLEVHKGEVRELVEAPPNQSRAMYDEYRLLLWLCKRYAADSAKEANEVRGNRTAKLTAKQHASVRAALANNGAMEAKYLAACPEIDRNRMKEQRFRGALLHDVEHGLIEGVSVIEGFGPTVLTLAEQTQGQGAS